MGHFASLDDNRMEMMAKNKDKRSKAPGRVGGQLPPSMACFTMSFKEWYTTPRRARRPRDKPAPPRAGTLAGPCPQNEPQLRPDLHRICINAYISALRIRSASDPSLQVRTAQAPRNLGRGSAPQGDLRRGGGRAGRQAQQGHVQHHLQARQLGEGRRHGRADAERRKPRRGARAPHTHARARARTCACTRRRNRPPVSSARCPRPESSSKPAISRCWLGPRAQPKSPATIPLLSKPTPHHTSLSLSLSRSLSHSLSLSSLYPHHTSLSLSLSLSPRNCSSPSSSTRSSASHTRATWRPRYAAYSLHGARSVDDTAHRSRSAECC